MANSKIITGDCRKILAELPSGSCQCCVTSPPYFGLRDYGVESQIGLESTPQEFVLQMVAVFREVKRVLSDDGTLWLNLGDSYARQAGDDSKKDPSTISTGQRLVLEANGTKKGINRPPEGLKPKDLIGIPWRVALALQADGWYLRQDIIWHKPNPMPEAVKDRCTKAHEYIFLLSKSEQYYFDCSAVSELGKDGARRNRRSVWSVSTRAFKGSHFATFPTDLILPCVMAGCRPEGTVIDPFNGAGTTGLVAVSNGRNYVGIELNPEYVELTRQRLGLMAHMIDFVDPGAAGR